MSAEWAPVVAVIGLALVIGATLVLRGPVGKALGDWIRGWSQTDQQWLAVQAAKHGGTELGTAIAESVRSQVESNLMASLGLKAAADTGALRGELAVQRDTITQELDALRHEVTELAERLDFAERLLAQERSAARLGPPR
ncbi:MAG TPA: hypothetical protein VM736_01460 [Gemmatimonadales bacterium]|nr:hypothetical protein [Gemmatimonadales bacterium]